MAERDREPRTASQRGEDHAAIERLTRDVLPALVAKLAASGLGEIEVREDAWKVRVTRPAGGAPSSGSSEGRRASDRPSRAQPGHAGHGHSPAGFEGHRSAREGRAAAVHSTNGSGPPPLAAVGPGPAADGAADLRSDPAAERGIATSPAVGIYQPRADLTPGTRVRAGDRLGIVDMLGVAQEVVAPSDGVIGASLAEPGQAVEYGQDLIVVDQPVAPGGEG
jgi:acetyl-CoA carboxylase biotin carboxyl carrier protein